MWKQAKVTVGDGIADQAMVDFSPDRRPTVLEWPTPLALNAEVEIDGAVYFADDAQPCGGKFHTPLMREPRLPAKSLIETIETQTQAFDANLATAEAAISAKKGK